MANFAARCFTPHGINQMFWLLFSFWGAAVYAAPLEYRQSTIAKKVYQSTKLRGDKWGRIAQNGIFAVYAVLPGNRACKHNILKVDLNGYICSDQTHKAEPNQQTPPKILDFSSPTPEQWVAYAKSRYKWGPKDWSKVPGFMPSIHGKRRGSGRVFASLDDYANGKRHIFRLSPKITYAFRDIKQTKRGWVLLREKGRVVPINEVRLFGVDPFAGHDMLTLPLPSGHVPAWVFDGKGANIYMQPNRRSTVLRKLSYHSFLNILPPSKKRSKWLIVPNADGHGNNGYIKANKIRKWVHTPPPKELQPDEVWVDINLREQVLGLRQGDTLLYATLVSSGLSGPTPKGLFRIYNKSTAKDFHSVPDSEDYYFLKKVPWVMKFLPLYAVHTSFWHSGFGHPRSHGCVNLAPKDAHFIFNKIHPKLPRGWSEINQSVQDHGTAVRIWRSDHRVKDRRIGPDKTID